MMALGFVEMYFDGIRQRAWRCIRERKAVSSAEYAVLAVGIVIVVASAIAAYDANNPLALAGAFLATTQESFGSR